MFYYHWTGRGPGTGKSSSCKISRLQCSLATLHMLSRARLLAIPRLVSQFPLPPAKPSHGPSTTRVENRTASTKNLKVLPLLIFLCCPLVFANVKTAILKFQRNRAQKRDLNHLDQIPHRHRGARWSFGTFHDAIVQVINFLQIRVVHKFNIAFRGFHW